jgi:hypothetical protein
MQESTMKKHVTLVAALQIGFSTIGLIGAIILYFVFSFAGSVVGDVEVATAVLKFIGTFLPTSLLLMSLLGFVGGIGLLTFQRWAKVLVMILAAIGCFFIPIGTIIGVYSLWVLLQDETDTLFH